MELRDNPGVEDSSAASPFEELRGVHIGQAWGMASRLTRCSADADDVMQDAFIVAWKKRDRIPENPWPWFCAVITNCARNRLRKNARVQPMPDLDPEAYTDDATGPDQLAHNAELRAEVIDALQELKPGEHEAVALCVLGGLSHTEASDVTGANVNTIKARVRRGLQNLRDKLGGRRGSVEAFLALPVLPHPSGGLEVAVSRWTSVAKAGGATSWVPQVTATQLTAGAGMLALVVVGAVLVLTNPQGEEPEFTPPPAVAEGDPPPRTSSEDADGPAPGAEPDRDASEPADTVGDGVNPDGGAGNGRGGAGNNSEADGGDSGNTFRDPETGALMEVVEGTDPGQMSGGGHISWRGTAIVREDGWRIAHGRWQYFYENGQVREEGEMVHGKKQGEWVFNHKNGQLADRTHWHENKKHGAWESYNEDGVLTARGTSHMGKATGVKTYYYPDGSVRRTFTYQDGKLDGPVRVFDRNSRLVLETPYRDGKRNGREIEFNPETSRPLRETTYRNGVKDGVEIKYHYVTGRLLQTRVNQPDPDND